MKKIASYALALCLMLSTFAGIGLSAMAEPAVEGIAITGITVPTAGGNVVTTGITGVPEGFEAQVEWDQYDYSTSDFLSYEEATFADNSVYLLEISLTAQGDNAIPWEESERLDNATVNGVAIDNWGYSESNDIGYTDINLYMLYYVGNITLLTSVEIDSLPAVAAGTATDAPIGLPTGAGYKVDDVDWYTQDPWERYEEATLAENGWYELEVELVPLEGYWIAPDAPINAPLAVDSYDYNIRNGFYGINFDYDLRPVVKTVTLTGIPQPAYGDAVTTPVVTVPATDNYTVEAKWVRWDSMTGDYEDATGTFGYGEYRLLVTVTPKDGYIIGESLSITIDGEDYNDMENWNMEDSSEQELILYGQTEIVPENGYVDRVTLSGAPAQITAGTTAARPTLQLEDGDVTVTAVDWIDAIGAPFTGKFENGKAYYLAITVTPAAGYALSNMADLAVKNGTGDDEHSPFVINADGTGTAYVRYSLMTALDKVEITVTEPKVGSAPAEPKVPTGTKYSIESYAWWEENSDEEATVFEKGKKYYLELMIAVNDGYELSDDATIRINGEKPYEYYNGSTGAYIYQAYSFKTQIDRVDITMPVPTLGGTGSIDSIKLPTDAKYAIDTESSYWTGYNAMFEGTFGKDKYSLDLRLAVAEGYEYAENVKVYLNGALYDDYHIYGDGNMLSLYYEISFRDVISEIAFPALPTVNVGDEAPALPTDVPEDAHYTLEYEWVMLDQASVYEPLQDAFEDGGIYYLYYYATPDMGYEFAEDVTVTVGGKKLSGCWFNNNVDDASLRKLYSFGVTVIDKVEITVAEPVIGQKPGKVTVPEDAGYTVSHVWWYTYETDDFDSSEYMEAGDVFTAGNYYWFNVVLEAKDGYALADELTYVLNGKTLDLEALAEDTYPPYNMADYVDLTYGFGKLGENSDNSTQTGNNSGSDKDTDKDTGKNNTHAGKSPLTGDTVPVALLSLMAVSAAGMTIALIGKKKYCR